MALLVCFPRSDPRSCSHGCMPIPQLAVCWFVGCQCQLKLTLKGFKHLTRHMQVSLTVAIQKFHFATEAMGMKGEIGAGDRENSFANKPGYRGETGRLSRKGITRSIASRRSMQDYRWKGPYTGNVGSLRGDKRGPRGLLAARRKGPGAAEGGDQENTFAWAAVLSTCSRKEG